ncbi:hypothetical protein COCMIDRAFT_28570 [Bipolaris oryzae ATCC 44560]|uniref:FAD-dependent oxidoreductase 2 FAD-binding domain-containing protein n=1 Tax=Bipolaris oryzae ATCC 44560 TaxID=930090 RepID=W6YTV4_COCMI|nr:uncharacterized protein COCMIDRAFT_28570 [Bipolaris oryzae ATCC 44560]EUC42887.1 hypothetical protein COCMIDRAFT_28570 [Bipolaris oryzae ATCC 44560]
MQHSPVLATALVAFFGLSSALALPSNIDARNIIKRDVAIIGGGSAGINAAIQLKDAGKSIIVIEAQEAAATGLKTDYGVAIWHNITTVNQYFQRFNIPLAPASVAAVPSVNIDYTTGAILNIPADQAPTQQAIGQALQKYAAFLSKYPQLAAGMFLPRPVPQELAMPFGQLVKQLGIDAAVPIFIQLNPGLGNPLTVPVVEMARVVGLSLIQQIGASSFVTTARHYNSELYEKASAELASSNSILLSSRVVASTRKQSGVELVVKTPQGIKYICAKKLLLAIPPRLENLQEFNPTQAERSVFSKWLSTAYFTSIISNTGLPPTLQVKNVNPLSPVGQPDLPSTIFVSPNGIPGLSTAYYQTERLSTPTPLTDDDVKARLIADIKRIQTVNRGNGSFTQTEPKFHAFKAHKPFYLQVSTEDILAGFYDQMNALQNQLSTFYTGAAWRAHDSSMIWEYNKQVVVPMLLKSLQN